MIKNAALALGASLALCHAGHATVYALSYDPAYPPIANLGWRASAELYVPDLCRSVVGTQTLTGTAFASVGDCAAIEVRDTVLELYDLSNPITVHDVLNIGDYLADVNGDSGAGFGFETQEVYLVDFVAGEVVDFRTSMSLRVQSPWVAANASTSDHFLLGLGATPDGVSLCNLPLAGSPAADCLAGNTYVGTGDPTLQITITRLPEPGSLALVIGALGAAAGFSRRAARPAPPAPLR